MAAPDLAGKIEMRRARHALDRNDVRKTGIGIDMSADDVKEIDEAAVFQALRDFEPVLLADAAREPFVGRYSARR